MKFLEKIYNKRRSSFAVMLFILYLTIGLIFARRNNGENK